MRLRLWLTGAICSLLLQGCKQQHHLVHTATSQPAAPYFIQLSDVHLNTRATRVSYGEDTGSELWAITLAKLTQVIQQKPGPAFIVYTGDLPAHYSCGDTCFLAPGQRAAHNSDLTKILSDLRNLVKAAGIPLLYVPGNNDSLAGDYYSFTDKAGKTPLSLVPETQNPYPVLNAAASCGIAPCVVSHPHPRLGFYSVRPVPGLRVIALNTIIWGHSYHSLDGLSQLEAGNEQMRWLGEQLAEARQQGDKVYLVMHIPPGRDAYAVTQGKRHTEMWAGLPSADNNWLSEFLGLVNQYQTQVAGIFYGHTHMDEVRRLYNAAGTHITQVAISAPGITPQHNNNPGFKIYWYSASSKALLDFETLYTTPTAEHWGDRHYRFSQVFHCAPQQTILQCLSTASLENINRRMDAIYSVMQGPPAYNTLSGIEVKEQNLQ